MPNPCVPFAFCNCHGPYLFEIRATLPAGYEDRTIEEGSGGWPGRYSELERTLNNAYDQHPTGMVVRQHGGEAAVECGATRVYRKPDRPGHPVVVGVVPPIHFSAAQLIPPPQQPAAPPPDNVWIVETYLHADTFPVGYRRRVDELLRQWLGTLSTIPLPGGAGDITVEVIGAHTSASTSADLESGVTLP